MATGSMQSIVSTQRQAVDSLVSAHQAATAKLTQSYGIFQERVKREIEEEAAYTKSLAETEQQLLSAGAISATKQRLAGMRGEMQQLFGTYRQAITANNAAADGIATRYDGAMGELKQIQQLMADMDADIASMLKCVADNKRVLHELPN